MNNHTTNSEGPSQLDQGPTVERVLSRLLPVQESLHLLHLLRRSLSGAQSHAEAEILMLQMELRLTWGLLDNLPHDRYREQVLQLHQQVTEKLRHFRSTTLGQGH